MQYLRISLYHTYRNSQLLKVQRKYINLLYTLDNKCIQLYYIVVYMNSQMITEFITIDGKVISVKRDVTGYYILVNGNPHYANLTYDQADLYMKQLKVIHNK